MIPEFCKDLKSDAPEYKFSICTLVSNPQEYKEMVESFIGSGFITKDCEYLYANNTNGNTYDGYSGLNNFLQEAQGEYIIICHQDVLLNYDNRAVLERRIEEISALDENWALLGNAGAVGIKNIVYRVFDDSGNLHTRGVVPQKVNSLDENFIVTKKIANLALSHNLSGFHFYATDICIIAKILGHSSYVVDFKITHKSEGKLDPSFEIIKNQLIEKYKFALAGRYVQTTMTNFYLSGSNFSNWFFENRMVRFFARQYFKWKFSNLR